MPTTGRYLSSIKNIPDLFKKIQGGIPPDKFNYDHLKAIGLTSSNDRAMIPLLKDLGFLSTDGTPTQRYRDYRDSARSRRVMAQALREAYPDLFVINERITKNDRDAVAGRFKSLHDSSDVLADFQARTFFALLDLADLEASPPPSSLNPKSFEEGSEIAPPKKPPEDAPREGNFSSMPLIYRIEIQLPPTKDVEVFRAIFKAMKEELFNA